MSMMILEAVPWSDRIWGLPFLSVLAPGVKSDEQAGRRHKTSIDWIRQMLTQVRRCLPEHRTILVVDGALAALDLGLACQDFAKPVTFVSRLQHNARLFDLPPENPPKRRGRKRVIGERYPVLKDLIQDPDTAWQQLEVHAYGQIHRVWIITQIALWHTYGKPPLKGRAVWLYDPTGTWENCVLFASDPSASAQQVIEWFGKRWNVEVTFEEVRSHLGFETQRQWNPLAILRSSPAILGLFSFVTLVAHYLLGDQPLPIRSAAWYDKPQATFSDVLAYVRRYLWTHTIFPSSHSRLSSENIPSSLLDLWQDILCYAS